MKIQHDVSVGNRAENTISNQSSQLESTIPSHTDALSNPSAEDVFSSIKNIEKHLDMMKDTSFEIEYDKDIDKVIIKYKSRQSGEVVSQIPSEQVVQFAKEFVKTIGVLFDKKI